MFKALMLVMVLAAIGCGNEVLELGGEPCVPGQGAVYCDDGDPCTADLCGPEAVCDNPPLDHDGDGHATAAGVCAARGAPFDDCCDGDPTISRGLPELCHDGRDNDCDGLTDCVDVADCADVAGCI